MKFRVQITRRESIADPEGTTTARALHELGYTDVRSVQFGRDIVVDIDGEDEGAAEKQLIEMCEQLLANPVIEDYTVERM